jgi:hypothetical protein
MKYVSEILIYPVIEIFFLCLNHPSAAEPNIQKSDNLLNIFSKSNFFSVAKSNLRTSTIL